MQIYENEELRRGNFADRDSTGFYNGYDFRSCYFQSYFFSLATKPELRSTIRDISITDCSQRGCTVYAAVIEDVIVNGLRTNGQLLRTHGAVFKNVRLEGKIERLMLCNDMLPSPLAKKQLAAEQIKVFRTANSKYYDEVDWAIDISRGEFKELEIRDIPVHLIRRDPETQAVVKRKCILDTNWKRLKFRLSITPFMLDLILKFETAEKILIAPKLHPKFHDYMADLKLLRKAGLACAD